MRNQLRTWALLTLYVDHVVCSPTIIVVRLLDKHVHLTELELVTLAFAALNFVTYGLWWNKPLNVQCPVCVFETR